MPDATRKQAARNIADESSVSNITTTHPASVPSTRALRRSRVCARLPCITAMIVSTIHCGCGIHASVRANA